MATAKSLQDPVPKDEPTIRAMFLQPFAAKLAELGKDLTTIFRDHGLHEYYLREPYEQLPMRSFVALLEDIAHRSGSPFLCLELAQSFRSADLGPFNAMLTSAETLREALECFVRFYSSWQTGADLEIRQEEEITTISYRVRSQNISPRVQDSEYFVSSIVSLIRSLGTSNWSPILIGLEHALDTRERRLKEILRCPVEGCQPTNFIIMGSAHLDKPRLHNNEEQKQARQRLEDHLLDLLKPSNAEVKGLVARTAKLVSWRMGRASIEIDDVAAELGHTGRTLRRRLASLGTSYRDIVQEQRSLKACRMLGYGEASMTHVAEMLGYSDAAVFSRAFKKWTGVAPHHYVLAKKTEEQ